MKPNNYTVPCGYYYCDRRFEFCSTAFVTPECLSCSGICSHYRVVNDPLAIERCESLCPEYSRRTKESSNLEATGQPQSTDSIGTFNLNVVVFLLIVLITLVIVMPVLIETVKYIVKFRRVGGRRKKYMRSDTGDGQLSAWRNITDEEQIPLNSLSSASKNTQSNCTRQQISTTTSPAVSQENNNSNEQLPIAVSDTNNLSGRMVAGHDQSFSLYNHSLNQVANGITATEVSSRISPSDDQTMPKTGTFVTAT